MIKVDWLDNERGNAAFGRSSLYKAFIHVKGRPHVAITDIEYKIFLNEDTIKEGNSTWSMNNQYENGQSPIQRAKDIVETEISILEMLTNEL